MADVHGLLTELHASLPAYRPVDADAFASLYAPLRVAADLSMIILARRAGRTDAFLGSLIHAGQATAGYVPGHLRARSEYVLLARDVG